MPFLPKQISTTASVSILVPLRNEERNISNLLASLKGLTYPHCHFLLLDDHSTDGTWSLLQKEIQSDKRFRVLKGKALPIGWVGKVHACHQLSQAAKGEYLLFIDADVQLHPDSIQHVLALAQREGAGLLTGFPRFITNPFLSKLLVPLQHFVVLFHLPLFLANKTNRPDTTAAHGAFLFFNRQDYKRIGGHRCVKTSLVEDVHLAREVKKAGGKVVLANITKYVTCNMYETNKEVWSGFIKNAFTGLNRSPFFVVLVASFYTVCYVLPFVWFLFSFWLGIEYAVPFLITMIQRFYIDKITNSERGIFLLHPLAIISFIALLFSSMNTYYRKKQYEWKGRYYV